MPTPEIDAATVPIRHLPIQATTLAGIATPLSGFTVPDSASAQITVILSVSNGVLFADTAPGGIIGGGGSNMIWIGGSAAQVNAKLATLVYVSPKPGADVIAVRVIDSLGHPSAGLSVPLQALPLSNPPAQPAGSVSISGGTITLDTRTIEGLTLNISERQGSTTSPALVLTNSILGAGVRINLVDENGRGETAPRLAIAGRVENDGTASFSGGPALITLAKGAVLTNAGRIEFLGSSAQVSGAGTLQNDGTVAFAGAAAGSPPLIAVAITGAGVISLGGDATVEIAKSVAASQTIRFEDAPRQPESLQLDRPEDVQAQIAGFVSGDQIVLANTRFDAAAYTQADAASGVLTLYDGAAIAARLHFAGSYQLSSFDLLSTGLDSLASSVRITPAFSLEASGHGSLDVYQFLDEALGTQMLTQDAGERDAIVASRHDLVYEGVGFRALDPQTSNPGAVPIYRFFDTTNGAHFFTASDAEKNGTLATRPDLIFEPSSTLYEHATQQAGDVPVFRFFDGAHGTHLYTADAGERAAILSTRIDLKDEGIAFYAPGR